MHVGDSSSQGPTPNRWISESDRSRSDDAESMLDAHRSSTSQCGDGFLRTFSSRNAEASRTASRAVPPARLLAGARALEAHVEVVQLRFSSAAPQAPRTTLLTHKLSDVEEPVVRVHVADAHRHAPS